MSVVISVVVSVVISVVVSIVVSDVVVGGSCGVVSVRAGLVGGPEKIFYNDS